MKSKKIISLIAACTMLLSMASCGSSSSSDNDASSTASSSKAESSSKADSSSAADSSKADSSSADDSSTAENTDVTTPELDGYKILWSDEFNGDKLDESIWSYDPHEPGWTNNELQEYTTSTDNVFVQDGHLVLKALKTQKDGKDYYTSGKVKTQGKKDFTYGKITVGAKVPIGQGLWPAAWMMPTDEGKYGQWPKCGEVDIMEVLGNDVTTAYCTLHYGEPHCNQQATQKAANGNFANGFHEYSVEWEPGEIRWYIDGEKVLTANDWFTAVDGEDEKPYPAPFNQPFYMQLNLAVGGDWPGNPDETTDFRFAEYQIDYVRVYQKPSYDTNVKRPEAKTKKALEDGNYVYNGNFAEKEDLSDDTDWKFMLFAGGEGSAEIKDKEIVIKSTNEGTEEYSVQLVQPDMPMVKGKKYRVTFDAYAEAERTMKVAVTAPNVNWVRYLEDTPVKLTTKKQTYTLDFDMTKRNDPTGRLEFNMGKCGSTATIHITNVRLEEVK
jgi:beta-glucanase (GH16 family)